MPYDIGETLKKYRMKAGVSVKEISDILVSKGFKAGESTIYSWENNNSQPTPGAMLAMCEVYGVENVLSAFGYKGYNSDGSVYPSEEEQNLIEKYRSLDSYGKKVADAIIDLEYEKCVNARNAIPSMRTYTYYQKIAAAGTGFLIDDIPVEQIEAPYMKGADFIIGTNGDSMEPTFYDGDLLYVQKTNDLRVGEIGIFILGGECFVKELTHDGLASHNPAYKLIPGSADIRCEGRVLGKVEM